MTAILMFIAHLHPVKAADGVVSGAATAYDRASTLTRPPGRGQLQFFVELLARHAWSEHRSWHCPCLFLKLRYPEQSPISKSEMILQMRFVNLKNFVEDAHYPPPFNG